MHTQLCTIFFAYFFVHHCARIGAQLCTNSYTTCVWMNQCTTMHCIVRPTLVSVFPVPSATIQNKCCTAASSPPRGENYGTEKTHRDRVNAWRTRLVRERHEPPHSAVSEVSNWTVLNRVVVPEVLRVMDEFERNPIPISYRAHSKLPHTILSRCIQFCIHA